MSNYKTKLCLLRSLSLSTDTKVVFEICFEMYTPYNVIYVINSHHLIKYIHREEYTI